ncbi:MAG: hypothetical protein Q4E75_00930 [bacterium]|nr:hypothetical protein [bacterium]
MINRKDKEDIYAEVVDDMYNNQIISEKTYDEVLGYNDPFKKKIAKKKMILGYNFNHLYFFC